MRAITWKAFAVVTTAGASLAAAGLAFYLAKLVYEAGGTLPACLTFGLVLNAVMRSAAWRVGSGPSNEILPGCRRTRRSSGSTGCAAAPERGGIQ